MGRERNNADEHFLSSDRLVVAVREGEKLRQQIGSGLEREKGISGASASKLLAGLNGEWAGTRSGLALNGSSTGLRYP